MFIIPFLYLSFSLHECLNNLLHNFLIYLSIIIRNKTISYYKFEENSFKFSLKNF